MRKHSAFNGVAQFEIEGHVGKGAGNADWAQLLAGLKYQRVRSGFCRQWGREQQEAGFSEISLW